MVDADAGLTLPSFPKFGQGQQFCNPTAIMTPRTYNEKTKIVNPTSNYMFKFNNRNTRTKV